jgi:hypothetical protein
VHGPAKLSEQLGKIQRNLACPLPGEERVMAKLTTAKKNAEPKKEFGLPEKRKYPMPDKSHARNAKARASQMEHQGKLSAADKKKIDAKANKILGK